MDPELQMAAAPKVAKKKPAAKKRPAVKKKAAKSKAKKRPAKKAAKKAKAATSTRTERLDMRLTKAEKAKVLNKATKTRRTVTSIIIEAIEKIK